MNHGRKDYNRIQDPAGLIPDKEPVFLVRGQDRFGWVVVVIYAVLNYLLNGQDRELTGAALAQAARMFNWPTKKFPDCEKE